MLTREQVIDIATRAADGMATEDEILSLWRYLADKLPHFFSRLILDLLG